MLLLDQVCRSFERSIAMLEETDVGRGRADKAVAPDWRQIGAILAPRFMSHTPAEDWRHQYD